MSGLTDPQVTQTDPTPPWLKPYQQQAGAFNSSLLQGNNPFGGYSGGNYGGAQTFLPGGAGNQGVPSGLGFSMSYAPVTKSTATNTGAPPPDLTNYEESDLQTGLNNSKGALGTNDLQDYKNQLSGAFGSQVQSKAASYLTGVNAKADAANSAADVWSKYRNDPSVMQWANKGYDPASAVILSQRAAAGFADPTDPTKGYDQSLTPAALAAKGWWQIPANAPVSPGQWVGPGVSGEYADGKIPDAQALYQSTYGGTYNYNSTPTQDLSQNGFTDANGNPIGDLSQYIAQGNANATNPIGAFLSQRSPEAAANAQINPFLQSLLSQQPNSGMQQLTNPYGDLGTQNQVTQMLQAQQPIFDRNLQAAQAQLNNSAPGRFSGAAYAQGSDLATKALQDFNTFTQQANMQGLGIQQQQQQANLNFLLGARQTQQQGMNEQRGQQLTAASQYAANAANQGNNEFSRLMGAGNLGITQQNANVAQAQQMSINPQLQLLLASMGFLQPGGLNTNVGPSFLNQLITAGAGIAGAYAGKH